MLSSTRAKVSLIGIWKTHRSLRSIPKYRRIYSSLHIKVSEVSPITGECTVVCTFLEYEVTVTLKTRHEGLIAAKEPSYIHEHYVKLQPQNSQSIQCGHLFNTCVKFVQHIDGDVACLEQSRMSTRKHSMSTPVNMTGGRQIVNHESNTREQHERATLSLKAISRTHQSPALTAEVITYETRYTEEGATTAWQFAMHHVW